MTLIAVTQVFGIHKDVKSYIERDHVDNLFKLALQSDKQILVYGSSKQGKTALVSKYCGYDEHIVYQLTPETELIDIYLYILSKAGIKVITRVTAGEGMQSALKQRAKVISSVAIFHKKKSSISVLENHEHISETIVEEVTFNISQPQEISDLLKRVDNKKLIILENFHYLSYEKQKMFSFDLRAFQELGVRFIILGVWREKNRMAQFNGDLLDRIKEIPVEPWKQEDFKRIVTAGEKILNVELPQNVIDQCCSLSFSSVGVFQDLLLEVCIASKIYSCSNTLKVIDDNNVLPQIVLSKADAYGARHRRSLEAIASVSLNTEKNKLYYPIIDIILSEGFRGIKNGMHIDHIFEAISKKNKNVKRRIVKNALSDIHALQAEKEISPPILTFDENSELLSVTDSTMYFFLKNADLKKFKSQLADSFSTREYN